MIQIIYLNYIFINDNVNAYLKKQNIRIRPNAGSGVWLSILLPTAVLWGALKFPESSLQYQRLGVLSLGLVLTTIAVLIRTSFHMKRTNDIINDVVLIAPAITSGFLLLLLCGSSAIFSAIGGLFSVYPYYYGVLTLLTECPCSLTFGEASVVIQAIVLFLFSTLTQLYDTWFLTPYQCTDISTTILQVGLLGIGTICAIVYCSSTMRSTVLFYGLSFVVLVGIVVPALHVLLQQNPILWILLFMSAEIQRIVMIVYWALCSAIAVQAVAMQIKGQKKASTIVRKYFHILAVAVYIPGIILDYCFLYLASGVILGLFIILEMLRKLQMPPVAEMLENAFSVFADEKDQGGFSFTPIYLFVGCSLPLWLHPIATADEHLLTLISGILSIGVGDTAASVFGTWFGKHRWSDDTKKTKEGTIGCIVSQLIVVLLLIYSGHLDGNVFFKSIIAIVITSVIEAKTDQVDNLALPLVMYILLL